MLATDRLLLRRWRAEDRAPFAALNADPEVMRHVGAGAPLPAALSDELVTRFEREWDERGYGVWAVEADGELAGFCGLTAPEFLPSVLPAVEVGWRLRRELWGRGYATEAARAAVDWGFAHAGLREVLAIVHPHNDRSLRVVRKLGMVRRPDRRRPDTGQRLCVFGLIAPE